MNDHLRHLTLALAATLALGCAGAQAPTAADDPPSLNVVRDSLVVGFIGGDFHYIVFIGTSLEDLIHHCTTRPQAGFNLPTWDQLLVNRPDESVKSLLKAKQVDVTVFEVPYFPVFADECDPLGSRHFTGTGAARLSENNQTFLERGVVTGGLQLTGIVTGEDGQQYRLLWTTHQVQTASSTPPPANFIDRVQLTPIAR